jgi:hypothetical protein
MEAALVEAEQRIAEAVKAAGNVTREIKKAKAGAQAGQVRELRRALDAAVTAAEALLETARAARDTYDLDEADYLASGEYAKELLAEAAERGVSMFEEDDRLLCYPSLLRVLPQDGAVEVDKRRDRRLRPSVLVAALGVAQARPPRFKAEVFLESLLGAYELLAAREDKPDPVLRLEAMWEALTLLPGQAREYTRPEFARDLYLLDQSQKTTTKSGRSLRWHASSGTRGAGVLTTVAKTGQQQRYWGASFSRTVGTGD